MKILFQSIGIVAAILIVIVATVAGVYLSYILGIALLVISTIFIVYTILKALNYSH